MLTLESGLIIWEMIAFGLLMVILRWFAWKPLVVLLDKRAASIRQSIQKTEESRRESLQLLQRSREALLQSEKELKETKLKAGELSKQFNEMMAQIAEKATDQILNETRQQIQHLKRQAIHTLQTEIGGLAVECAAIIIDNALDDQKHKELIDRVLLSIPSNGQSKD